MTLAGCFLCGNIFAQANLGHAYVSNVTSTSNCVYSDTNDGGVQFWDIQAGGTYTVTLSGVDDRANGGDDPTMEVFSKTARADSSGGNTYVLANQTPLGNTGVYTFRITLTTQCFTMPIVYGMHDAVGNPSILPSDEHTGLFARDFPYDAPPAPTDNNQGHLRTVNFDSNCVVTCVIGKPGCDQTCQGLPTPTPTPIASITVCKFYDQNTNGIQDGVEPSLTGWPFCINPLDNGTPALQTQLTANGGCATWSNLTVPGDYVVTEANANESNWFHSTADTSLIVFPASGGSETRTFGNYCTSPSNGLTLGFWSNKNGCKILTGSTTGATLYPAVVTLLNSCQLVNANGTIHTFTNSYSLFKTWLLGANATNMAYMLSAQLATLKLDVNFAVPPVDGNAFDLCSHMTVNALIGAACDSMTGPGNQYTLSGNPSRPGQEMLKNCIDKINNNGAVVPVTPCSYTFPNPPAPCP